MAETEIEKGSRWSHKDQPEERVQVLGFGTSVLGYNIVRFMGPTHRALAMARDDFLVVYEPVRRTIYERLLDED